MTRYSSMATVCLVLLLAASALSPLQSAWAAQAQPDRPVAIDIPRGPLAAAILMRPDLTVTIEAPARAVTGTEISVKVTVHNKGKVSAPGTADGAKGYMVDVILSSDPDVPLKPAVHPSYAGKTDADYIEDMLMRGGRISNTKAVAAGSSTVYDLPVLIPKRTPPGLYCVVAYVDSQAAIAESNETNNISFARILVAQAEATITPPPATPLWVMPYGVGGTMLNQIKPSGLVDYFDSLAGLNMTNAPFGGRLGFRHGWANAIPTPGLAYYRWSYRPAGGAWIEFNEPVAVHYVAEVGGVTSFPAYPLGPKAVAGKNLYEFKPHAPPPVAGGTSTWPTMDWFGDIYTGFLNTPALADGLYQIRLEVFNSAGAPVTPGPGTFRFLVPTGVTAGGTITTAPAPPSADPTGFIFALMVNNRQCTALIDAPAIGATTVADKCGFLLYPAKTSKVSIDYHALHPQNYATFAFSVIRGINVVTSAQGEITATTAGAFAGDGSGNFSHDFTVAELLGDCPDKAAYAEHLYVYAKATTGWGTRLAAYDASYLRAFALAPVPLT